MGRRRSAQLDGKVDTTPRPKMKPKRKGRRKAVTIPDPPTMEGAVAGGELVAPKKGMVFKTVQEVCEFYNRYAQRLGFATKIKGSSNNRSYIQLMCWKGRRRDLRRAEVISPRPNLYTNCPATISVRLNQFDGMFHVKQVILEHNHELNPLRMHFYRDDNMMNAGVKKRVRPDVGEAPAASAQDEIAGLDEREWMSPVEEVRHLKLENGDVEAMHRFFCCMQASNSNFFYLMDMDKEGHLKNVFWADGRSRAAYRYFGDVILVDTSCLRGKNNLPLVTFVGVNHHGQSVLMGCGLLANETAAAYMWLFRAWLSCMSGRRPNAVITDHGKAIQDAVASVFPGCPHRQCLWQIMNRLPEKLEGCAEYKDIKRAFKKVVYDSSSMNEFEVKWKKMIEKYDLVCNEWLKLLYQDRRHWVPACVKSTFWAGLSTTQRGENMDPFFDGHVQSSTSLKQFLREYGMALETKYENEALADFESFHKSPPLFSQFYMEEQLSKVYSIDIFVKFQDELKALVYCHPSLIKKDESVYTFEVTERTRAKCGKMMDQKNYEVIFNSNDQDVQCVCRSFQYRGILCRHALSVFNFQDVDEIPSQYVMERWRKDFKGVHNVACPPYEMVANGPMERYENLYKRCLKLVEVGTISDDKYEFALKVLNRTMEKLLEDNFTCKGKQIKIVTIEPITERNNVDSGTRNVNDNTGSETDEVDNPIEARQKGRKKRKEAAVNNDPVEVQDSMEMRKKEGKKRKESAGAETLGKNKEKEQTDQTNAPAFIPSALPLNYRQPSANPMWTSWSFQHMNQVQPPNLIYYAAAPVNHPQYGIFLNKDQLGNPRFSNHTGTLWGSQQTLKKTQNSIATPALKKKRKKNSEIVELSP